MCIADRSADQRLIRNGKMDRGMTPSYLQETKTQLSVQLPANCRYPRRVQDVGRTAFDRCCNFSAVATACSLTSFVLEKQRRVLSLKALSVLFSPIVKLLNSSPLKASFVRMRTWSSIFSDGS